MVTFACVNWRNYQGRGVEYVNVLFDSIRRNIKDGTAGRFVCFVDQLPLSEPYHPAIEFRALPSDLEGWYNKLALFSSEAFEAGERVVYFDLDTAITGSLDEIAAYTGDFAILRDTYRPIGLQSSVMLWEAGKYNHIWDGYVRAGCPIIKGGDQAWIEAHVDYAVLLQRQFPGKFFSYKRDARFNVPPGASVVYFHGEPRPHQVTDGWVSHIWKVGGASAAQLEVVGNTEIHDIEANVKRSEALADATWITPCKPHKKTALICAGGPSIRDEIASIQAHKWQGADVFSCNAVPALLSMFAIKTDVHVIVDARPENAQFVRGLGSDTICLYASQCDQEVHKAAKNRLVLWHPAFDGIDDIVGHGREHAFIGGGTTCGMKAATLAWALGYRKIHLYGFDSCYRNGEHHAYPQSLNDQEQVLDVSLGDKTYKCAPWMIQQAEDFEVFGPQLIDHEVELIVHGTGLIPDIASQFSKGQFRIEAADFRAAAILERLQGVDFPRVAEIGVFAGDLSRRLLARREDLRLLMIDNWQSVSRETSYAKSNDFHSKLSQETQNQYYDLAKRVTEFAGSRAQVIRANSKEAASAIDDESLDLVFIDADHSYEGCKADIQAYFPKVRPGGYLAGHDYAHDGEAFGSMVKRAVDEFVQARGLDLELGENYTWFAYKPREHDHGL